MKYYKCPQCKKCNAYYRKFEKNYRCHSCSYIFNDYNEDNKDVLCEAEVRKNIVLAEVGQPLTIPLSILQKNCEFKKEWNRIQKKWHGTRTKEWEKEKHRIYSKKYRVAHKKPSIAKEYEQPQHTELNKEDTL